MHEETMFLSSSWRRVHRKCVLLPAQVQGEVIHVLMGMEATPPGHLILQTCASVPTFRLPDLNLTPCPCQQPG